MRAMRMPYFFTLTEIELSLDPYQKIYDMYGSNHAEFHASIDKVNNSTLFWTLAARLYYTLLVLNVDVH